MCVYISNTTAASITLLFDWDTFDYTATVKSAAYWIICIQQWGLTEEAYLPTINFSVSFTSIPAVVGTPIKDYASNENYFGNNSIESVTISSFVARQTNTKGGTKAGAIRYIAVGY